MERNFAFIRWKNFFEKIDEFQREYQTFKEEPLVREYLAAELEICRLVQEIYGAIDELVDIDMETDPFEVGFLRFNARNPCFFKMGGVTLQVVAIRHILMFLKVIQWELCLQK